ncbi:MAG: ROK family transcriptional regulator [Thermodesulfobacteriota bacterium]|nr:ROK family transcriptional regulator [Thermodesulfobacteriota bacterium]
MFVANKDFTRSVNRYNILNSIRVAGQISRVELAAITGQSKALVTNITARLIKEGLIYEKEAAHSTLRGRKRTMLALKPDAVYAVGVKIADSQISFSLINMLAEIRHSLTIPVRTNTRSLDFISDLIEEGVRHCLKQGRLGPSEVAGIGIGVPGFVDMENRQCLWNPFYGREPFALHDHLQKALNLPVYLENDANAVTLAELWYGEGRNVNNFIVVTVEQGIGLGVVINGELYRGSNGFAGEFGHATVCPGGRQCRCGKKGCLEAYASETAIIETARKAGLEGRWQCDDPAQMALPDIRHLVLEDNPVVIDIFSQAGKMLGYGISGLIQIFNPSKVIICGEGVRCGSRLFDPMRQAVADTTNEEMLKNSEIVVQKWTDTDWARGAACLVLQEVFKSRVQFAGEQG